MQDALDYTREGVTQTVETVKTALSNLDQPVKNLLGDLASLFN